MDDDEDIDIEVQIIRPRRHDRWSVIVLTASLVNEIAKAISEHIDAATDALQEHRYHKIEEARFYEVVRDGHSG